MSIKADFHMHSHFSGDSDTPMEEMILQGIRLGLDSMCFTEHIDIDFPYQAPDTSNPFDLKVDSYLYDLANFKAKYADQIQLFFGVEIGIQPHLRKELALFAKSHEFDFILSSLHVLDGADPYYPSFFDGKKDEDVYRHYFETILEGLRIFQNFDVCSHLDYIVRYGKTKDSDYSYAKYQDILDPILQKIITLEKGIELNTRGIRCGLREFNPCSDLLKRYRALGGEIITVGSDAHVAADIASDFSLAADVLTDCGFKYYCTFEKRHPEFHRLSFI